MVEALPKRSILVFVTIRLVSRKPTDFQDYQTWVDSLDVTHHLQRSNGICGIKRGASLGSVVQARSYVVDQNLTIQCGSGEPPGRK